MAERNSDENRRFVYRPPDKDPQPYFIPVTRSGALITQPSTVRTAHVPPKVIRSAESITARTEVNNPARRVVVIRSSKHPEVTNGPVDLGDFGRSNSRDSAPVISDGNKSVFLIRRTIGLPEPSKTVDFSESVQEPSPLITEHGESPTLRSQEIVPSLDPHRSTTPPQSPPIRPKSSKRPENTPYYVPYLRRSRSKTRTPSPVRTNVTHRSASPKSTDLDNPPRHRPYRKHPRSKVRTPSPVQTNVVTHHSPSPLPLPPPKQEEPKKIKHKRSFCSCCTTKPPPGQVLSPVPVVTEHEEHIVEDHSISRVKSAQPKTSTSSHVKSVKPVILVHPDDDSIVVVESSHTKGESVRTIVQQPKSYKKTRFQDEINDGSTERLVKTSRRHRCLGCLSRHMCLILIICLILILIGLAGVGVSAYYFANNSTTNFTPGIIGIIVGGVLAIAALCFFCILLGCIGSRDGYYSYNNDGPHTGGRAFALIPPSHPNAHLYIPRDYMKLAENHHPSSSFSPTNGSYSQSSMMQPVSTISYIPQQTTYRSNLMTNGSEYKSTKNNITIEMPERLIIGRRMSPRTRERSLNKVVKNVGHIVEDVKKRNNGNAPSKVIVKVDPNAMETA